MGSNNSTIINRVIKMKSNRIWNETTAEAKVTVTSKCTTSINVARPGEVSGVYKKRVKQKIKK